MRKKIFNKIIAMSVLITAIVVFLSGYIIINRYYKSIVNHQQKITDDYNALEEAKALAPKIEYERQQQEAQKQYENYIEKYINYYRYAPGDAEHPICNHDEFSIHSEINEIPDSIVGLENTNYSVWFRIYNISYKDYENYISSNSNENLYYPLHFMISYNFNIDTSESFRETLSVNTIQYLLKPIYPNLTFEETKQIIQDGSGPNSTNKFKIYNYENSKSVGDKNKFMDISFYLHYTQ